MTQDSVTQFLQSVKQNEALREKAKVAPDPQTCVMLAEEQGYHFTIEELQTGLSKLSQEELMEVVNPGIAPRRHLDPK